MKFSRLLVLVLLVAVAAGAWLLRDDMPARLLSLANLASAPAGQAATGKPGGAPAGRPPSPVETAAVKTGTVSDVVEAVGTLTANESVTIAPEIAGRITALSFEEGQLVEKGETLVELDSAILEGELKQAQSELALAEDAFARASQLAKKGSGTVVALEQATAQRAAARVRVGLAEARLAKTKLSAPFSGVAGLRNISIGNFVTAGQAIVTVTNIDPIKVDFRLPETYLGSLRQGQKVELRVDAFPDRRFEGEVYAIDPVVDVNGRAVKLRARIPNKDRALAPGLFARVSLTTGARENAMLAPESALVPQPTGPTVFVVKDGVARQRAIKLGKRLPGQIEVLEGLEAGEQVVTAGQMRLREGARVNVQSRQAEAAGGGSPEVVR